MKKKLDLRQMCLQKASFLTPCMEIEVGKPCLHVTCGTKGINVPDVCIHRLINELINYLINK